MTERVYLFKGFELVHRDKQELFSAYYCRPQFTGFFVDNAFCIFQGRDFGSRAAIATPMIMFAFKPLNPALHFV